MEEQNKEPQEQNTETESSQDNKKQSTSMRSCILMLLAGGYLIYTGYRLCKNVMDGVEGGGWGFFAAGVGFLIVGVVMLVIGVKDYIKIDKEKRAREATVAEQKPEEPKGQEEKKSMSIAERARLASNLDDTESEEKTEE